MLDYPRVIWRINIICKLIWRMFHLLESLPAGSYFRQMYTWPIRREPTERATMWLSNNAFELHFWYARGEEEIYRRVNKIRCSRIKFQTDMQINNLLISSDLQANLYDLTDNIRQKSLLHSYIFVQWYTSIETLELLWGRNGKCYNIKFFAHLWIKKAVSYYLIYYYYFISDF